MRLTRLFADDVDFLRVACTRFLRDHLRWWSHAYGLGWSDDAIEGHLVAHDLVARDVQRLLEAARAYQDNFVAVARDGDQPVGAIWAESHEHPFLRTPLGVVAWIYVDPTARGAGVGSELLAAAFAWMRQRGLTHVELKVIAENTSAVRLYERAGLRIIDYRMGGPL